MPKFGHNRADDLSHLAADSHGESTRETVTEHVGSEAAAVISVLWLSEAGQMTAANIANPKGPSPSVQNCGRPLGGQQEETAPWPDRTPFPRGALAASTAQQQASLS